MNLENLQIISKNIHLQTNSDTEVLLESIANFGLDFIKEINGMFAFVLYDREDNCIYLFRDRLGIKPIFFSLNKKQIIFSSEISHLLFFLCFFLCLSLALFVLFYLFFSFSF